jgi:hypothetical protein
MRKVARILVMLGAILGIGGMGAVSAPPVPAGAVPVVCPVGDQGWVPGGAPNYIYQCVMDDNHMLVVEWNHNTNPPTTKVVFDKWIGHRITATLYGGNFNGVYPLIRICGKYANAGIVSLIPSNPPWEHRVNELYHVSGSWFNWVDGVLNHFHFNHGGFNQAFGLEVPNQPCPYGLGVVLTYGHM